MPLFLRKGDEMSYIAPNTTLKILSGVTLDPSYINTIYFETKADQTSYFESKAKYVLTNLTYQRHGKGKLLVEKVDDDLYDCGYIMFQNTSYGNKWFYAFILDVEYVSNTVSEITYQIDVMQTWLFDVTLLPCMIERNHLRKEDDVIGASITPEPTTIGEYVYANDHVVKVFTDFTIVIQTLQTSSASDCGVIYEKIFSGCKLWAHRMRDSSDLLAIKTFIAGFAQIPQNIIGMYLVPSSFIDDASLDADGYLKDFSGAVQFTGQTVDSINGTETFDGYTPRNKKLYTFPYNYCEAYTGNSKVMPLRYEFADSYNVKVNIDCNVLTPVSAVIRPTNYKGLNYIQGSGYPDVFGMAIEIDDFPLCSWVNDSYSTWVARNAGPMAVSALATVAGIIAPLATPTYTYALTEAGKVVQSRLTQMTLNPEASRNQARWFTETAQYDADRMFDNAMSAVPNFVEMASAWYQAKIAPENYRGATNHGNNIASNSKTNLYGRRAHITKEQAMVVDSYFDKYGYAIGRIGAINRAQRSEWTYVKTQGCVIKGNCPALAVEQMQSIYNRGITWWKNGDHVGQYNLSND